MVRESTKGIGIQEVVRNTGEEDGARFWAKTIAAAGQERLTLFDEGFDLYLEKVDHVECKSISEDQGSGESHLLIETDISICELIKASLVAAGVDGIDGQEDSPGEDKDGSEDVEEQSEETKEAVRIEAIVMDDLFFVGHDDLRYP